MCGGLPQIGARANASLDGLREHAIDLKIGWTPEQIAGRLGYGGHPERVSHETIYAYVYSPEGQSESLARYLQSRRKKRRPRHARRPRDQVFPPDRSIHRRPERVKARDTFGEWEGDLMIFERAQGSMNVASLVEHKTRYAVLFCNNDRNSTHVMNTHHGCDGAPAPERPSIDHLRPRLRIPRMA
uniref:IS30 family transposase n=1 Tax=Palleronia aestuarii TaxID=568105 RepID=UPI003570CBFA